MLCVQDAIRLSLLYCLHAYRGDENIKTFIWDLITPGGGNTVTRNHSGLSAPVPRGRKGKKARKEFIPEGMDWLNDEKYDAEAFLDKNYRWVKLRSFLPFLIGYRYCRGSEKTD